MPEDARAAALRFLADFTLDRCGDLPPPPAAIGDAFDSLTLIDFFLALEGRVGDAVTLDDLATCRTFGDLRDLLVEKWPR